ncbi:MAG: thiol peroxidase [Algicola sp.]|nr:thiol peroxidase [Algicola sp.]
MIYKILFAVILVNLSVIYPAYSTTHSQNDNNSSQQVKIGDKTVLLSGQKLKPGDKAPDFKVVDEQFKTIQLSDFSGKTVLINVVSSIDTSIDSVQTKRFNQAMLELPANVMILTISADLPFAQKRFSNTEKVDRLQLLSDSVWRDFGLKYGLLIKDMGLLTRAVLIVDSKGYVNYQQIVPQLSQQPDYEEALKAVKVLASASELESKIETQSAAL